ncbi:hypothetical protein O6H91_21G052100 [Diphasiastrum complanatum]|uniref:Uncharacterized protein n=2 Tax=Diphasiastrum complanatum TaxID=34168 RepID=A0ACC2AKN7_DIPCM|nr:hypothetical protein O6H91_21G052100 [Diphasiastrum complanatum]KAJ7518045.1 hypothetical protein O6H91_21G052100 [Diphasiastrum complanatum]
MEMAILSSSASSPLSAFALPLSLDQRCRSSQVTASLSGHHANTVLLLFFSTRSVALQCSTQGFADTGFGSSSRRHNAVSDYLCSQKYCLDYTPDRKRKRKMHKHLHVCFVWRMMMPYVPVIVEDSNQMRISAEQRLNGNARKIIDKVDSQKTRHAWSWWGISNAVLCFQKNTRVYNVLAYRKGTLRTCLMLLQILGTSMAFIIGFGVTAALACDQRVERNMYLTPRCQIASISSLHLRSHKSEPVLNLDNLKPEPLTEQQDEDAEAKRAFEEWKSKPYALTVPLKIVGLRGSVPPIWLKGFLLSQGKRVKLAAQFEGNLKATFTELSSALQKQQMTPRSPMAADLVTIGDSWLGPAIALGLLKPIEDADQSDWFHLLGCKWQDFLRRDENGSISSTGKVWGVPYRCGCLVIAYKKDKLLKLGVPAIKDWNDLWRPELSGKISMVDSPREVVGAVLKSLGASYNSSDFEKEVPGGKTLLKERFCEFRKQIRIFDSINYLKALGAGDVCVAVGWSADVIPFAKRASNIAVVAPESGTSLWADLWAVPAATSIKSDKIGGRIRGPSPLVSQWFEFCLQPARALSFEQGAFAGASPLNLFSSAHQSGAPKVLFDGSSMKMKNHLTSIQPSHSSKIVEYVQRDRPDANTRPKFDTNIIAGLPPSEIISRSEFLQPLHHEAIANYEWLFMESEDCERHSFDFLKNLKRILSTVAGQLKFIQGPGTFS